EIDADEPCRADESFRRRRDHRGRNEEEETEPDEEKPVSEFRRARGITLPEADPEPREDGGEQDDEDRVDRLIPGGRKGETEECIPAHPIGEEVEAASGLLEGGPEERGKDEEDADGADPLPLDARERLGAGWFRRALPPWIGGPETVESR